ncbi:MAG TPA: hypothetical protein VJ869_17355 [Sphaerochaeta sp.]|nr:hypothetical protein [Sphaerochaeta sp.]
MVLKITEHEDGTYTLNHLTYGQMRAIQHALIQNAIRLVDLKKQKQAEGHDLNSWAESSLQFADEASDQLLDMGF